MESRRVRILVVDDDVALLAVMEESLKYAGDYCVSGTNKAQEALALIESDDFDIVVSDYHLDDPDTNGLDILKAAKARHPEIHGIIVTAFASLEISLEAIRLGAYDFLTKPFQVDELTLTVRNAAERVRLQYENSYLRDQVAELANSLAGIREDHDRLSSQFALLQERSASFVQAGVSGAAARTEANAQVSAYLKIGKTISEQLDRENSRLDSLFQQGLISEPTYRKGLEKLDGGQRDAV